MTGRWHDLASLSALVAPALAASPLGLLLRAFDALVEPGARVLATGLAHGPFDGALRSRQGEGWLRFLPLLDERVSSYGPWQLRGDVTQDAEVLLGDSDVDLDNSASIGGRLMGAPRRRLRRQRRIDTLFPVHPRGANRIAALVLVEELPRVRAVLAGADALMRPGGPRPALLLPLPEQPGGADEREAILARLDARGYRLLDSTLALHRPRDVDDELIALRGEWMLGVAWPDAGAVLARSALGLDEAAAEQALGDGTAAAWNRSVALAWARELRTGGLRLADYPARGRLTLPVNGEIASWGFHAPEGPLGDGWRWIGPRPAAGVVVPSVDRPLQHIDLVAPSALGDANRGRLTAVLDGRPAHVQADWSEGYGRIRIVPKQAGRRFRPMHELELLCAESRRASADDARLLAMSLSTISLVGFGA